MRLSHVGRCNHLDRRRQNATLGSLNRRQYLHARGTLRRLLELGVVPVVNENDAVANDEIRFGDNDRMAALVAHDALRAVKPKLASRKGYQSCGGAQTQAPAFQAWGI